MYKRQNENLVSAPTVIADSLASLDDADALINDDVTSSVMLKVELEDGELVCYSGETRLGSFAAVSYTHLDDGRERQRHDAGLHGRQR